MTRDELLDAFRGMTLLELSEFVKDFQREFGVSTLAPQPVPAPPVTDEAEEDDGPLAYEVMLREAGAKKIQVIKEVRVLTRLGLKEAKDLVDSAPVVVLTGVDKDAADKAVAALENAGALTAIRGL